MNLRPLPELMRKLPSRDKLVGMRVFDHINEDWLYVKDIESGLWCGRSKNDDFGNTYDISRLMYNTEDME